MYLCDSCTFTRAQIFKPTPLVVREVVVRWTPRDGLVQNLKSAALLFFCRFEDLFPRIFRFGNRSGELVPVRLSSLSLSLSVSVFSLLSLFSLYSGYLCFFRLLARPLALHTRNSIRARIHLACCVLVHSLPSYPVQQQEDRREQCSLVVRVPNNVRSARSQILLSSADRIPILQVQKILLVKSSCSTGNVHLCDLITCHLSHCWVDSCWLNFFRECVWRG